MAVLSPWEAAARHFEPRPRRWPTPGAMAVTLDSAVRQSPALDAVDRELAAAGDGHTDRLAIFMAVQEGKSQRTSRWFPLWLLAHDKTLRIGIASYEYRKAERWGKAIRQDLLQHRDRLGLELRPDSRAAGQWHTRQGGGVVCAGVGSALTGEPLDVLIIDDPVKGRKEVESPVFRQAAWDWWEGTAERRLSSRLAPNGVVVLICTRWHTDDLAGRLLAQQRGLWRVLSIPAIAGQFVSRDSHTPGRWEPAGADALGRTPGEEMPSAVGRPPGYFHALHARLTPYSFRALYQQDPTSPSGNLFRRDRWRYWSWDEWPRRIDLGGSVRDLADCFRFLTVDLAASTRTSADWTCAAAWALTMDRQLVCLGRVRERVAETGHWPLVAPLAREWDAPDVGVESSMIGTLLVRQATRAGLNVFDLHADRDKVTRAQPAAFMVNQGQVWLPEGADWLDELVSECADFPLAANDDQVDVLAYAARVAHGWHPMRSPATPAERQVDPVEHAMSAALGNGHHGVDPLDLI